MAPLTRSSMNRRPGLEGPKKSTESFFRGQSPEQSWELTIPEHGQNGRAVSESRSFDGSYQEDEMMSSAEESNDENMPPKTLSPDDHEDILHPLREAANRVGREVEQFAAILDRFNPINAMDDEKEDMSFELLDHYQTISTDTVQRLRNRHRVGKKSRSKFRGIQLDDEIEEIDMDRDEHYHGETTPEDLDRWEQEANTWDLLRRLMNLKHRNEHKESPKLTRFSSERDYWDAFLNTNDLAAERATVLEWLKNIAEDDGEDIDDLVQDLKDQANREQLNHSGWLYTKLQIKSFKRTKEDLHGVLDPSNPLVKVVHLDNNKIEVLVTQLDPDAPCRQKLKLQQEDTYFERAVWLGCYEMLRRGTSREKIREWCEEQRDVWRAVSMSGLPDLNNDDRGESSNQTTISLWRRMCYANATRPGTETYERAVYGILSGDLASVEAVCKSWDDLVYAHYNSLLTSQFEHFLRGNVNPDRASLDALQSFRFFDSVQYHGEPRGVAQRLIESLKAHPKASSEAKKPMKMIQGVLIANEFDKFIEEQGLMLSHYANSEADSVLFPRQPLPAGMDLERSEEFITMKDHDSLRVLTHMILVFKNLGLDLGDENRLTAIENVIVAYINFLKLAGMEELIPTYAAQLSDDRKYAVLGRTLIDVLQPEQRETLIHLMQELDIDVQRFVLMQTRCLMKDYFVAPNGYPAIENLQIIGIHRNQKRVLPNFIFCEIDRIHLMLIRSLEWYLLVDGLWVDTFAAGAELYKLFFRIGNLSAAELLFNSVPSSVIAQSKSQLLCGQSIDLDTIAAFLQEDEFPEDIGDHEALKETRSKRRILQYMFDSAKCYRELEMLERALDAMDEFATHVEEFEKTENSKTKDNTPAWRRAISPLYLKVRTAIEPLLHNWLSASEIDDQLHTLRLVYLPDVILGYNWILNFSGHLLSRACLLESMDLATVIADDANRLSELFVEADKMEELVEALAGSSEAVVKGRETSSAMSGLEARRMRREKGMTLGVWGVEFQKAKGLGIGEV